MRAVVFAGHEKVAVESLPDPSVEAATDAVLQVETAAICGSDLHPFHEREEGLDPGTVMGHEAVGRIVAAGSAVARFRTGDRVACPFTTCCGRCEACARGLTARCRGGQLFGWRSGGQGLHGMQAGLVRIPLADSTLVAVPEETTDEEAILAGDIFSTGWFCNEMGEVGPETGPVAVIGCGPVGLMAVAAARMRGAEKVLALDSVPGRLTLAERFGAEPVNVSEEDAVAAVREATGGLGVASVLEAVGAPPAMRLALELVRPGGILASVGVHTAPEFAFTPSEAYDRNLTFRTGRCPARRWMEHLLPRIAASPIPLAEVFTHRLSLEEGPEGYRLFDGRLDGCVKVALHPGR